MKSSQERPNILWQNEFIPSPKREDMEIACYFIIRLDDMLKLTTKNMTEAELFRNLISRVLICKKTNLESEAVLMHFPISQIWKTHGWDPPPETNPFPGAAGGNMVKSQGGSPRFVPPTLLLSSTQCDECGFSKGRPKVKNTRVTLTIVSGLTRQQWTIQLALGSPKVWVFPEELPPSCPLLFFSLVIPKHLTFPES